MTLSLARIPRLAWYLGGAYVLLVLLVAAGLHRPLDQAGAARLYVEPACWARAAGERASAVLAAELCLLYALALGAFCAWRRRPFLGGWIVVMLLATVGVELVFKYTFDHPGPSSFLSTLDRPACGPAGASYPFTTVPAPSTLPSGYSIRAAYFGVLLAALIGGRWPFLKWLAWPLLVGAALVLAASRVMVGWHWPSDVAAGVLLGGAAAFLVVGAAGWFAWLRPADRRRGATRAANARSASARTPDVRSTSTRTATGGPRRQR